MRSRAAAALSLALLLAACSSDEGDDDADADPGAATAPASAAPASLPIPSSATPTPSSPPVGTPSASSAPAATGTLGSVPGEALSAPMEAALTDTVRWLADPATVDEGRFTPAFLAEVPIADVRAGLATLGGGTWTVTDVQPLTAAAVVATVRGPDRSLTLQLELDAAGLIDTLFFENAGLQDPPATIDALLTRLEAAGERSGFLLAEIAADGTCAASAELRPDELLPVASTFKLYVLGALADAVAAGTVAWDQPVTIRDALDSPGVGETQDAPDGSTATVQELALQMISVSDNTATDHLIDLLGRDGVEAALGAYGHHDPAATRPLPTTREMSIIKLDPDLLARYAAVDEAGRRALLAGEVAAAPTPSLDEQWAEPRAVEDVEWFASPRDLCRALVALDDASERPGLEPLTEILSTNPGMVFDPAQYSALLFKGGSEPGVLVGAWLGRRVDGTRVVVTGGAASPTGPIDPSVIELVGHALTLA